MFARLQPDFAGALVNPSQAVPEDIASCHTNEAARRFNIYRNNVAVSLLDALAARFPVTCQIVGKDFFKSMARMFIHEHPPTSPMMMFYGDGFPDFIAAFEPAAEIVYLADIARLEAARTRAYHAEDRQPLDAAALRTAGADSIGFAHFDLHPSMEIISSSHPVVTIWAMHEGLIPLSEIAGWEAQSAVVIRPRFDVDVCRLPPGGASFLQSLKTGKSLAEAVEDAMASHSDFDLAANLALLFSAGLAVALSIVLPKDVSQ